MGAPGRRYFRVAFPSRTTSTSSCEEWTRGRGRGGRGGGRREEGRSGTGLTAQGGGEADTGMSGPASTQPRPAPGSVQAAVVCRCHSVGRQAVSTVCSWTLKRTASGRRMADGSVSGTRLRAREWVLGGCPLCPRCPLQPAPGPACGCWCSSLGRTSAARLQRPSARGAQLRLWSHALSRRFRSSLCAHIEKEGRNQPVNLVLSVTQSSFINFVA